MKDLPDGASYSAEDTYFCTICFSLICQLGRFCFSCFYFRYLLRLQRCLNRPKSGFGGLTNLMSGQKGYRSLCRARLRLLCRLKLLKCGTVCGFLHSILSSSFVVWLGCFSTMAVTKAHCYVPLRCLFFLRQKSLLKIVFVLSGSSHRAENSALLVAHAINRTLFMMNSLPEVSSKTSNLKLQ